MADPVTYVAQSTRSFKKPEERARPHAGRNVGLDMLRAVLVSGVLGFHYAVRWAPPDFPLNLYGYDRPYARAWSLGAFGVHAFFMISGYVITLTVLRSHSAWRFARSRFLRIYPGLLIAAILAFVAEWTIGPDALRTHVSDLAATLILLPTELHHLYVDGAFWTLTVEAKFYAFVALGFVLFKTRFWWLLVAIALAGPPIYWIAPGIGDKVLLSPYIGLFLVGMAIWYWADAREQRTAFLLAAAGFYAYLLNYATISYDGGVSWMAHALLVGAAGIIFLLARINPDIRFAPAEYLGRISYEIYLVHQVIGVSVIGIVKHRAGLPDFACALTAVGISICLAAIIHHLLAPPVRRVFARLTDFTRHGPAQPAKPDRDRLV